MRINGIIAEYNPFHNGHKYQLEESLRRTGANYTIVAMSGNFVQRGAPALADKRMRAETALRCGADLVLELPVLYATSSAEYFADSAVAIFDKLGVVTHLCFGSECGDAEMLSHIAHILLDEPQEYRNALKRFLKQGLSFPQARTCALFEYIPGLGQYREALSSPNNILGVDYMKALLRRKSKITPVTIERIGSGYHDPLPDEWSSEQPSLSPVSPDSRSHSGEKAPFCSAYAIRKALQEGCPPAWLSSQMPKEADRLLNAYMAENRIMQTDDFSANLYYKLLMEKKYGYEKYFDATADISNRIRSQLYEFNGFSGFCSLLKTKELTYTRISRCLLHILLGIEKEHMLLGKSLENAPYARVLGFRKTAAPLLRAIKEHSLIPLVTKLADAEKSLGADACRLLDLDIITSEFYRSTAAAQCGKSAPSEFSVPLVIL